MTDGAQKLTRAGVSLNYIDEGRGPPVLLIHGFPDLLKLWRHQVPALLQAGHRVIAADNRGIGESDAPPGRDAYALDTIVPDVVALLDTCAVDRVDGASHWLMLDRPAHINRLLLNFLASHHLAPRGG